MINLHYLNRSVTISVSVAMAFALSAIPSEFMRKNFLYRMLYSDIY